jgi:phenylpropionate dioxygenase-like ring-hydroxylating dioxygenase large terminal subunit
MSTLGRPTVPWSWYSDPAILAMEMERIFRRSWQYVGHLGELQGPGSYFASETGPVPIVITFDADSELRGFVNVCRHRGAIVATDAAKRGTIQCPYHAWTYGLDGCLRAAPRADEDPAFDSSRCEALVRGAWRSAPGRSRARARRPLAQIQPADALRDQGQLEDRG